MWRTATGFISLALIAVFAVFSIATAEVVVVEVDARAVDANSPATIGISSLATDNMRTAAAIGGLVCGLL